jgi:hypothetical protein
LCELRVAEAPVEIPGGGMRCAKSGALEAAERPARVFADVRLSSRMANQESTCGTDSAVSIRL